ncbi:MAG: hypothetical protein JWO41_714 [Candidatus Saccharibacteria bacterium]|nr:hypothetical protein [Candidatus Saccharibacteria bacterium]
MATYSRSLLFCYNFYMQGNATNTDEYLKTLPEWQQKNLMLFRELVHAASPDISEEIKWGVPVFIRNKKMAFSMGSFKAHTKYNFISNGAELSDNKGLFNNGLESKKSRSIDLQEGQSIDKAALEELIRQAVSKL